MSRREYFPGQYMTVFQKYGQTKKLQPCCNYCVKRYLEKKKIIKYIDVLPSEK